MNKSIVSTVVILVVALVSGYGGYQYGYSESIKAIESKRISLEPQLKNHYIEYVNIPNIVFSADTTYRARTVLLEISLPSHSEDYTQRIIEVIPVIRSETLRIFLENPPTEQLDSATARHHLVTLLNTHLIQSIDEIMGKKMTDPILITKMIIE
ncbi:hypothetical protein N9R79_01450 [Vibrio sp.]|nr:hypothetical protein [Vibrio sp.]